MHQPPSPVVAHDLTLWHQPGNPQPFYQNHSGQWVPVGDGSPHVNAIPTQAPPSLNLAPRPRPRPAYTNFTSSDQPDPSFSNFNNNHLPPLQLPPPPSKQTFNFPPPAPVALKNVVPPSDSDADLPDNISDIFPKNKGKGKKAEPRGKKRAASPKAASEKAVTKRAKKDDVPVDAPAKKGRRPGATGYSDEDLNTLLRLVSEKLPIGNGGWQWVTEQYNLYAKTEDRPQRSQKPLKGKYDSMVRATKPTGDAELPPLIQRAKLIDNEIERKSGTLNVDDSELDDDIEEEENDVIELSGDESDPAPPKRGTANTAGSRRPSNAPSTAGPVAKGFRINSSIPPSAAKKSRGALTGDLVSNITAAFDPANQSNRDEARFARTMVTNELSNLRTENRDLKARCEQLLDRVSREARRADRAEAQSEMMQLIHGFGAGRGRSTWRSRDRGGDDGSFTREHRDDFEQEQDPPPTYQRQDIYRGRRTSINQAAGERAIARARHLSPSHVSGRIDTAHQVPAASQAATREPSLAGPSRLSGLETLANAALSTPRTANDAITLTITPSKAKGGGFSVGISPSPSIRNIIN